jgi:ADP-ribose pyrophosphatase YjhB (NUDIX family)
MPSYYRDPYAPTPNQPRRFGVVALIEIDGAIVQDRRADDCAWAFPGGGVEEDESVLDALRLDEREETGLAVESAELLGVFSDPTRIIEYPGGHVCHLLTVAFTVVPQPGSLRVSEESLELRLVPKDELETIPLWSAAIPIRDALLAGGGIVVG